MKEDLYKILEIDKSASDEDISKAYHKMVFKHHPDRNQNNQESSEKFKKITQAYEILSDKNKRLEYDRCGLDGDYKTMASNIHDMFNVLFRNRQKSPSDKPYPIKGENLFYNLNITLEESCSGVKKDLFYEKEFNCESCKGSGLKEGKEFIKCNICSGTGRVEEKRQQNGMFFRKIDNCYLCGGSGIYISNEDRCSSCNFGRRKKEEKIILDIPVGIKNGQKIVKHFLGNDGYHGGPNGDLTICITVLKHDIFTVVNNDIYVSIKIPYTTFILGGECLVPTPYGNVERIPIPENTTVDSIKEVGNFGLILDSRGAKGRLYAILKVLSPKTEITDKYLETIKSLREQEVENNIKFDDNINEYITKRIKNGI